MYYLLIFFIIISIIIFLYIKNVNVGCNCNATDTVSVNDINSEDVYTMTKGYGLNPSYPVIINSNIIPPYPQFHGINTVNYTTNENMVNETPFEYRQLKAESNCY